MHLDLPKCTKHLKLTKCSICKNKTSYTDKNNITENNVSIELKIVQFNLYKNYLRTYKSNKTKLSSSLMVFPNNN